jgi:oxalate---CoA ligase
MVVDDKDPAARLTNEPGIAGEVCLRAKNIMSGCINDPRANAEAFLSNGYFRTGDLGALQSDGYLRLLGRIKEMICKAAGNVSPAEIEHVAQAHGSVAGVACFRIADGLDDHIGEQSHRPATDEPATSAFSRCSWC